MAEPVVSITYRSPGWPSPDIYSAVGEPSGALIGAMLVARLHRDAFEALANEWDDDALDAGRGDGDVA